MFNLTLTVSCCCGVSSSGRVMVNFSFPVSSRESAFCPGRNCSGMMPIPTSCLLWSFSKLSAMTARTPYQRHNITALLQNLIGFSLALFFTSIVHFYVCLSSLCMYQ